MCGRDARAPRGPSSHGIVRTKGIKLQKHYGGACCCVRLIRFRVHSWFVFIAGAAGGFVRAGRPRSRGAFIPWDRRTKGIKLQKHLGGACCCVRLIRFRVHSWFVFIAGAAPVMVRAGRPRSQGAFIPWDRRTKGTKLQEYYGGASQGARSFRPAALSPRGRVRRR